MENAIENSEKTQIKKKDSAFVRPKSKHKPLKLTWTRQQAQVFACISPEEGRDPCPWMETIIITDRGAHFTQAGLGSKADTAERGHDAAPRTGEPSTNVSPCKLAQAQDFTACKCGHGTARLPDTLGSQTSDFQGISWGILSEAVVGANAFQNAEQWVGLTFCLESWEG